MKIKFVAKLVSFLTISCLSIGLLNATPPAHTNKDGEILGILMVVDKNEIAIAEETLKKSTAAKVKKYAAMLKAQHEKNLKETIKTAKLTGISPQKSKLSNSMKRDGKKELKQLSSLNNMAYDKAFIQAMIKGHMAVIEIMDNNLLKNVTNDSVKKLLVATRPHLEAHLKKAQAIAKTQG